MRYYSLAPLAASLAFIAAPAFAQNIGHTNNSPTSNPQASSDTTTSQSQGSGQSAGTIAQDLVQSLQKAGFTHIRIEPEAFIIHARNSHGQPVLMRISPDSMEEVTAMQSGNGTQGSGQQHASNGSETTNQ